MQTKERRKNYPETDDIIGDLKYEWEKLGVRKRVGEMTLISIWTRFKRN